jgi:hypothetical protein
MPNSKPSLIASLVAVLALAACAHKPVDPTSASFEASAAPPALNPTKFEGIMALGKRLSANRLALYSATHGKYLFFVGGVLTAEYETATAILRISSLEPSTAGTVCEFSSQGALFVDPKVAPDKDAFVADCDRLALLLNDYLSR